MPFRSIVGFLVRLFCGCFFPPILIILTVLAILKDLWCCFYHFLVCFFSLPTKFSTVVYRNTIKVNTIYWILCREFQVLENLIVMYGIEQWIVLGTPMPVQTAMFIIFFILIKLSKIVVHHIKYRLRDIVSQRVQMGNIYICKCTL